MGKAPVEEYWLVKWRKKKHPPEAFLRWKEDPSEMPAHWYSVILCSEAQVERFLEMLKQDREVIRTEVLKPARSSSTVAD